MTIIPRRKKEAGFTIVETMLCAVLVVLVFVAFGAVYFRVTGNVASLSERASQNGEASVVGEKITQDLGRAGESLTFSTKSAFSGEASIAFEPNAAYEVGDGYISRSAPLADPLVSSMLWRGRGELQFGGSLFSVSIRDAGDQTSSRSFVSRSRFLAVVEDGEEVFSQFSRASQGNYAIRVDTVMESGVERCRTSYLVDGAAVYESSRTCISNPVEIVMDLPAESPLYGVNLLASELRYRDDGAMPVRVPLLPLFRGSRLNSFVLYDSTGFVVFSGGDSRFLAGDYTFDSRSIIGLMLSESLDIVPGDVLFVCDYAKQRSVLLDVVASEKGGSAIDVLPRVSGSANSPIDGGYGGKAQSDFADMQSDESDFSGFTFLSGTRVVKLIAPVEYRVSTKDATPGLFRRLGSGPWEMIAPNVENFLFAERTPSGSASYEASLDVLGEGVENGRTASPVRVSISPRALNRTFDTR